MTRPRKGSPSLIINACGGPFAKQPEPPTPRIAGFASASLPYEQVLLNKKGLTRCLTSCSMNCPLNTVYNECFYRKKPVQLTVKYSPEGVILK